MARYGQHRRFEYLAVMLQLNDVFIANAQPLGRIGTHKSGVVPDELREGFGQFLEPDVVGPPPIPDARVGTKDDFQALALARSFGTASTVAAVYDPRRRNRCRLGVSNDPFL